jgi:hypothetical protein
MRRGMRERGRAGNQGRFRAGECARTCVASCLCVRFEVLTAMNKLIATMVADM